MSVLKRFSDEIRLQVGSEALSTLDGTEDFRDYELDLSREISLTELDKTLAAFQDRILQSADDAAMAVTIRESLQLSPREAADRNTWWWLTLSRYPKIVRERWASGGVVSSDRMIGPVNRNAFARLWWGAELVRTCIPRDKYTKLIFKNQDLFEAVIGRSLARYPDALKVLLDELAPLGGLEARETVRDFRFLLSTLVLEGLDEDAVRRELKAVRRGRAT